MNFEQYNEIAQSCDRLLNNGNPTISRVAVSWLHVQAGHPLLTANYASLVPYCAEGESNGAGTEPQIPLRTAASLVAGKIGRVGLRLTRSIKPPHLTTGVREVDVILVSNLVNVDHLKNDQDFYYGKLQQNLSERGLTSLLVWNNQTGTKIRTEKPLRLSDRVERIILPNTLSLRGEVKNIGKCWAEKNRFESDALVAQERLDQAVARRAAKLSVSVSVLANLRLHAQLVHLCTTLRPAALVTLYEGHAWERCAFNAAKTVDKRTLCLGYQHTILWEHSHAVKRTIEPGGGVFDPDWILTVGKVTQDLLRDSPRLEGVQIKAYGTHRFLAKDVEVRMSPGERVVLVLPEGILEECIYLFNFAVSCAEKDPSLKFIFRTHPVMPFDKIKSQINGGRPLPENVSISLNSDIAADYRRAEYLLYRGSSTVIYAVLEGLQPFYVSKPNEMEIDPLFTLNTWRKKVATANEFHDILIKEDDMSKAHRMEQWNYARDYCQKYVMPVDNGVIDELAEWVWNRRRN